MSDQDRELKPCPFCGGETEWREDDGRCDVIFGLVANHDEHCWLNGMTFEKAETIAAWNTRATPKSSEGELLSEALPLLNEAADFVHPFADNLLGRIEAVLAKAGKAQS